MSSKHAIKLANVSKQYWLYPSYFSMGLDILGLSFLLRSSLRPKPFVALSDISFEIKKGERVGIIGRNGAGKSTLLKLVCGAFKPTSGFKSVDGQVQALMDAGVGFYPAFTGRQNIDAALNYNGLSKKEKEIATSEIIEFVELGEFLDQPLQTYSLGMRARLGFAVATAVKPEILIIDEVLSAGDGYFANKCVDRVRTLTSRGVTLLLVSHSSQQILQFCERVIWLNGGKVFQDGPAMEVVKNYEKYIRELDGERMNSENQAVNLKRNEIIANQNISRWPGMPGLKISEFKILNANYSESSIFNTGDPLHFRIKVRAQELRSYSFVLVVFIYSSNGHPVSLHISDQYSNNFQNGQEKVYDLTLKNLLLGNGEFFTSVAIYKKLDMNDFSSAEIYDLIDRSFKFKVISANSSDPSLISHPSVWLEV